ncbi:hypothetical protein [Streptomyces sp. NPDC006463]|uniref:hypothetical protein n=1 Tax=Streptomyces sp. NPDC006463 TaxID=3364746 RepID=UPI00369E0818
MQPLQRAHALVTARPSVRPGDGKIGTSRAHAAVMEFAGLVKAPIGHALRGKEWIQYDKP